MLIFAKTIPKVETPDKSNDISPELLIQVNKYYPEVKTASQLAEIAGKKGHLMKSLYGDNWKAYDNHSVFIGASELQGDAWAKVLLYSIDNKHYS